MSQTVEVVFAQSGWFNYLMIMIILLPPQKGQTIAQANLIK